MPREGLLFGDALMADHAARNHDAMAGVWSQAARALRAVDLSGWSGEAGDAARAKLGAMRTLMLNQADVLHRVAEMERQVSAAIATMRTQIDAVMAEGIPLPAAGTGRGLTQAETGSTTDLPFAAVGGAGIPVQATTTLVMTWLSFGLVVRATITVGKLYDERLYAHSDGALKVAGALVLQGLTFVGLNLPAGVLSAVFFESTAVATANAIDDDTQHVWSGPRIAALTGAYIGTEAVGWAAGSALGASYSPGGAIAAGQIAGAVGGLAGPALVSLALGAITDWRIWVESTAIGLAGGGVLLLMNKVYSGPAALAVAATQLAALGRAAGHHIAGRPGG